MVIGDGISVRRDEEAASQRLDAFRLASPAIWGTETLAAIVELVEEVLERRSLEWVLPLRRVLPGLLVVILCRPRRGIDIHLHGYHRRLDAFDERGEVWQCVFLRLSLFGRHRRDGIGELGQSDSGEQGGGTHTR